MEKVKLAIIGAGPAGISTAIEAKRAGIEPVVILEKTDQFCHTIQKFYKPGKRVDANYRGSDEKPIGWCKFETETKEDFLKRIESWIKDWNLDIKYNSEVTDIKKKNDKYEIYIKDKPAYVTDFVVIGIGIFGKPRKPSYPIPKEVKDKVFFEPPSELPEGKKVLVVGGGNTAAETAISLCEKNQVDLSYRREKFFRLNEINLQLLEKKEKEGKIKLLMATDIEKLEPTDGKIKVYFKDGSTRDYDYICYCLGGSTPKGFLRKIGIEFLENGEVKLSDNLETSLPKVFLVGDIAFKQGNITKAFNSGKIVIDAIKEKYLKR